MVKVVLNKHEIETLLVEHMANMVPNTHRLIDATWEDDGTTLTFTVEAELDDSVEQAT